MKIKPDISIERMMILNDIYMTKTKKRTFSELAREIGLAPNNRLYNEIYWELLDKQIMGIIDEDKHIRIDYDALYEYNTETNFYKVIELIVFNHKKHGITII